MAESKEGSYISMGNVPLGTIVAFALDKSNIPQGWLLCDGSPIPSQYAGLITVLNSNNTPNLCGQTLIGTGKSPVSGNTYNLGQTGGEEQHTLGVNEIPSHSHTVNVPQGDKNWNNGGSNAYWGPNNDLQLPTSAAGGGQPHNNMQPYYAINYIIYAGQ